MNRVQFGLEVLLTLSLVGCADGAGGRGSGGGYPYGGASQGGLGDTGGGQDDDDDDDDDGDDDDDDDDDGTGGDDGQDDDDAGGDGAKFDTPNGTGGQLPEPTYGCAKVDFVFVVDSSASMLDEQENLQDNFPEFISAIEDTLMIEDFHIMVVDTGPQLGLNCDTKLGAGENRSGSGQDCGLGSARYATQDTPNLSGTFSCMASRGIEGPANEVTMDALIHSITVENDTGECNEGFLRDDALLVVTIITDEEDDSLDGLLGDPPLDGSCVPSDDDFNSFGSPNSWKQAIVDAKGGDEEAAVVLALVGDCDVGGSCPGITYDPGGDHYGAEPAPRLRSFANSFVYGSVGPVCAADYEPFFTEAVSVIDNACDNFEPPA